MPSVLSMSIEYIGPEDDLIPRSKAWQKQKKMTHEKIKHW